MKAIKLLPVLLLFVAASCSSVRVYSDYDNNINFSQYKTYAFHKKGIDRVEISELDKKRILNAIDRELSKKGMTKSENPDLLINILTNRRKPIQRRLGIWMGLRMESLFMGRSKHLCFLFNRRNIVY
jgi:Domain of unknown function (DUF4136)